jgi:hypothetical protein
MRFEHFPFSPQLIQARWVLGKLPSEEVPRLAQSALGLAYDGKNIRRIAGLTEPNSGDLQPLMNGFFTELGIHTELSMEEAGWLLARFVAEAISEARVTPYEGARFIWRDLVNQLWPNEQHPLLAFVGEASEYEDCESYSQNPAETRRQIDQSIIEKARTFATLSPSH